MQRIGFAILAVLLLASVGFAQEAVLRWDTSDWITFDPAYSNLQAEAAISVNIYSGLVRWDEGTVDIVPDLATHWDISEDGTVYTFYLRDDAQFHHGFGPVTAHDVKFTFDRITSPDTASVHYTNYRIIKNVEVIDDYTVQIELESPYAPFLLLLVPYKAGSIVSQAAMEARGSDFGTNPVGSGPFEWVSGDPRGDLVLRAFDDYYGGRPAVDRLVFTHISEEAVVDAAFRAGDLDIATVRDSDTLARYMADPNVVVYTNSGTNLNYITMNPNMPPFDDIRVRQAVLHAIDKDAILATVLDGIGAPLTGPVPTVANFYEPDVPHFEYDPALSRQLLAEAGYPNGFRTTLFTYIGGPAVPVSTIVQDMLRQVGIQADLRALEIAAWSETVASSEVPMTFMRLTRSSDPHEFLVPILHSQSVPQSNYSRYNNPRVDELIHLGSIETEPERRAEIYSEIQKIVVGDAVAAWIFSDVVAVVAKPYVKGFELDPLFNKGSSKVFLE